MGAILPVDVDFGPDAMRDLEDYVKKQIQSLNQSYADRFTNQLPKWRRLYRGTPKDAEKNFPWKNASNLVVQVIGTYCDTLRARVMGSIYEILPLFVTALVGEWNPEEHGSEQQEAIHELMNVMGLEPKELNLYEVESRSFDETIKYGTVTAKVPWEHIEEMEVVGVRDGKPVHNEVVIYDGPKPFKIPYEDFMIPPQSPSIDEADFVVHIKRLTKYKLEERKFTGQYKAEAVDAIISSGPDRPGPTPSRQQEEQDKGLRTSQGFCSPEWDIYECHFPFWHNKKKYRIIYTYHYKSKTKLRAIFNYVPKGTDIFIGARLGYSDDQYHGFGFCEMLEHYQEEASVGHNQRVDNRTLANTSLLRVGKQSKLDAVFSVYPNALIPADEGEIEKIQLGSNYPSSVEEEHLTLQLAEARAGVDSGTQGSGGGQTNPRKGIYSAMGTFAVMQAGNRRVNLNTTDMRYFHLRLGRSCLNQYANFGIGERVQYFGQRAKYLLQALDSIKAGRLLLPIRAATASVNKELEKQNDMLLTTVMQRHQMGIAQILQSISNPQMPPEMKEYLLGVIDAGSQLMDRILRNFAHDDTSRLLPEKKLLRKIKGAENDESRGTNQEAGRTVEGIANLQGGNEEQAGSSLPNEASGLALSPRVPTGVQGEPQSRSGLQ